MNCKSTLGIQLIKWCSDLLLGVAFIRTAMGLKMLLWATTGLVYLLKVDSYTFVYFSFNRSKVFPLIIENLDSERASKPSFIFHAKVIARTLRSFFLLPA